MKKHILLDYLRLIRPPSAGSTGIMIIIGYLAMIGPIDLLNLSVLFIIGIFSHIFTFVLNEYIDIKVDEKSKFLKDKPLVSGAIPKSHALYIALFSCVFAFIHTTIFFWSFFPLLFLLLALLSGGIYDIWGKIIPGSDVFIAGGCFFGCLFGASIVSINFTNLVYIISLSAFIFLVFCNVVVGGLKDADHDPLSGAKTTATRMGVKIENGKMLIPKKFKIFSYALELIFIILIFLAIIQPEINILHSDQYILQIIILLLVVVIFVTLYKFLNLDDFERSKLYRLFVLNGTATYLLIPIILLPIIGITIMLILLILPTAWLLIWNFILYGKIVQPQA